MSSFKCEICGTDIIDTPQGYVTGCEHYPLESPAAKQNAGMQSGQNQTGIATLFDVKHVDANQNGK